MTDKAKTYSLLSDIPLYQKDNYQQPDMLVVKQEEKWKKFSTSEVIEQINQVSAGLLEKGLKHQDKIGIISHNRPEWNFVDLGASQIGVISVPIYPKINEDDIKHIANDSGIKILFIENNEMFKEIDSIHSDLESVEHIYSFDKSRSKKFKHWEEFKKKPDNKKVEEANKKVKEDDVATLVYTSGTTGKPKGVMLTHKNIVSNIKACLALMPVNENHKTLSFLPLNHVFERMLNYLYMAGGLSIYYAESIDKVADNLKEVKPNIFTTVPRLLEKIYEKIVSKGKSLSLVQKGIFFWALGLAKKYELDGNSWFYNKQLKLADKLVFSKWREAVGGEVIAIISGGAALNENINRVFCAAKIPIMEGYGLTETSPVITVNRYEEKNRKIGTVGSPLDNVEVKIADDGEILCKGPSVMKGYCNLQEKTDEVLGKDGWFHTEDIGELKDGFLAITDRKKHMFKTSGGKYVAPQNIEGVMKESHLIGQIMIIGEGKKMVTALIVPDFENLKDWCKKNSVGSKSNEKMVENEKVKEHFQEIVEKKNKKLNSTETIKKFMLLSEEWTEESGELTPTLKVKRRIVEDKHEEEINKMYEDDDSGIDVK